MVYEDFGMRVRQQRKLAKLTQDKLAEKAGISQSFLGHIESGKRKASVDTLVKLCNALEVSPNVFLQDSLKDDLLGERNDLSDMQRRMLREVNQTILYYSTDAKKEK